MSLNRASGDPHGLSGKDLESSEQLWKEHVTDEVFFWRSFCETRGLEWAGDFHVRLDPDQELQPYLQDVLKSSPISDTVSILDVGAGPMTYLGKRWPGKQLRIVAVDPLAGEYAEILKANGLSVPIATIYGRAEDLGSQFKPNQFDLVHARNCLDHSIDPVKAIHAMAGVVRPGCFVYLEHKVREGKVEGYQGLHQWDFYVQDGRFHISSPRYAAVDVTASFEGVGEVSATDHQNGWMTVTIRKSALPSGPERWLPGFLQR